MNVLVTLNPGIGGDLGPDFLLTCDVEGWSQVVNETDLYNGIELTIPDGSTVIYIQSLGICLNILTLPIEETTTTTTSTSTSTTTTTSTTEVETTTTTTTEEEITTTTTTTESEQTTTTTSTTEVETTTTTTTYPEDCSYIQVELIYPTDPCEPTTTTSTTTEFVEPPCNIGYSIDEIEICESTTTTTTTVSPTPMVYGLLYNNYAAVDVRNIANTGWKVPTATEANTLISYITANYTPSNPNIYMRQSGTTYWVNGSGTNATGFTARGAGERIFTGDFSGLREICQTWTTSRSSGNPQILYIDYVDADVRQYLGGALADKTGCNIRLINESTTLSDGETGTYTGNDGKLYTTICIGTQEWTMPLQETKYRNLDIITEVTSDATWGSTTTGALCAYNNDWNNV